eukprot:SAG11_NODE_531_length_8710_cov_33.573569_1_plen_111_part_00
MPDLLKSCTSNFYIYPVRYIFLPNFLKDRSFTGVHNLYAADKIPMISQFYTRYPDTDLCFFYPRATNRLLGTGGGPKKTRISSVPYHGNGADHLSLHVHVLSTCRQPSKN